MNLFFTNLISESSIPRRSGTGYVTSATDHYPINGFAIWKRIFVSLLLVWSVANIDTPHTFAQGTGLPTGFSDQLVLGNWDAAVGFTFNPAGTRMYVWEKGGKVWIVENGVKLATPLIDISDEVGNWWDHGLLGFALDPEFESNGYFYLLYVVDRHHLLNAGTVNYDPTVNQYTRATIGRLTRYRANPLNNFRTADLSSRKILMGATASTGLPILQVTHGVGSLVFGTDHTLLVSLGDGASPLSSGPDVGSAAEGYYIDALADGIITPEQNVGAFRSQQLESLNGKIIRIDPETGNGIPSNPYYDPANPGSTKSKVWALGLRNPSRMSLRPGTGSHNPSEGNPGVLYVGDVGWDTWEEMDVVTGPGLNFGWPLYEGLEASVYATRTIQNRYVTNPLYGTGGCTQQYLRFIDLLKQPTANGLVSFPNPCNTSQQIPASVPYFVHTRPVLDWKHGTGPSRTGTFNGNDASVANLGSAGSVPGPQFGGSSAIGGVWYTGDKFPVEYQNKYFLGDYGAKWIRSLSFDGTDKLQQVDNFINGNATVVYMGAHPTDGALYYINYASQIRKVTYIPSGNQPPTAIAAVDKYYGISPLTVQFTGSNSTDPESLPLTYEWNFGDGSPVSNLPNPSKIYNAPAGIPTKYNVTLKVTDNQGLTSETSLFVSVNNTPPVVNIISPVNNSKYTMSQESTVNLTANVTDSEHSGAGLTYQWQTILYHNDHNHPNPYDTNPTTTATIIPIGCDGNLYYFEFVLTVTDAAGLSTTKTVRMDPDCASLPSNVTAFSATANDAKVNLSWTNPTNAFDELIIVAKEGLNITADPAGDGSAYQADLSFTGTGSLFDGGKVVYKGTVSPKTITGLTNNTRYYFKAYTRKGSIWSTGVETSAVPRSASNIAPVVNITAPANNISYTQGAAVTIQATASDSDGEIAKVEFYAGTTKLAEDVTSPYSFTWKNIPAGSYTITAKAYDNLDAVTTSGATNLNINSFSNTTFYRAINLNGTALTIDNNAWEASTATNYTLTNNDGALNRNGSTLFPSTDANRALMLTTAVAGKNLGISINNVPNGEYDVYVYVWEDNRAILINFSVEGQSALQGYNTGYGGYWEKLGPWRASISDGNINIGLNGGSEAVLLSGVEIRKVQAGGNNALPTVSLTAPANNASFTAGSNVTLTATAADSDGSISKVEFYQGLTKLGEDLTSPYEFIWNSVTAGSYQLTAKAVDNLNATGTSSIKNITVTQANHPPVVNLTSPANNQNYTAPASINIIAQASDGDGSVSKVEFYRGTTKLGEDLTSPYEFAWNNVSAGSYQITAKAIDNQNATGTSSIINIVVTPGNQAPTVSLTAPANNASFTAGSNVTLTATAADSDGSVAKVEFYEGTTKLGEDLTSPYTFAWNNVAAGAYQLTAKAIDNLGASTTSAIINISITSLNQLPLVSLTSPSSNASFVAPASVTLAATASDGDGSVSKVEFYQGTTKLGEDLTSPYTFAWNNVVAGAYQLTAKAIDNSNAITTSAVVNITVSAAGGTLPAPWAKTDIGNTGLTGNATHASGTFTLQGAGYDIWNAPDAFHFVYQPVTGNAIITARVVSIQNTNENAKAGVMIRNGLDANAIFAATVIKPATGTVMMYRQNAGTPGFVHSTGVSPHWLRIERNGTNLISSISIDGTNWNTLGVQTLPMGNTIYVGMLVVSFDITTLNTSVFDNVSVVTSQQNQPPVVSLSTPTGSSGFSSGDNITLVATASDGDGSVSKVEFYQGTTKLGEDLTSPYEFTWNNVAVGAYQLTAKAIDNLGASTTSAPLNITVSSGDNCTASGSILREVWTNVTGSPVSTIPVNTTPNLVSQLSLFEAPSNFGNDYGQRIRGYICPPQSGNYIFWIASDDNSELWLSPDTDPSKKVRIATVGYFTGVREWDKYPAQKSVAIALQAGKSYYIEALHKEGLYGDNLAVGWQLPDGTLERPITGNRLSPFTTSNIVPSVSLTAPTNNASFVAPASITLTATASDNDGSVAKVEFYQGTTKLGEDLTSPYTLAWNNVAVGAYQLTAKAIDNLGASTTSAPLNITVSSGDNCTASGSILREVWTNVTGSPVSTIPVNTTPNLVSQLSLFEAPSNFGNDYGQRIRGYICPPQSGNYIFWIASDDNSELWLSPDTDPSKKVRIATVGYFTGVREWDKYPAQKSVAIALQAGKSYYIEALHKEGLYGDNLAVGWQLPDGTLERPITGNRLSPFTTSNIVPSVSLTAPTNNASFVAPASITLTATASDNDGSVAKVEFYQGTTKLGEDLTSPYEFTWNNVAVGAYQLTAKAIDNSNAVTTSALVNITVTVGETCTASGSILREVWTNVTGNIGTIPVNTTPNIVGQLSLFEAPSNFGNDYGQRIRGYICPPQSGNYIFWIASDDNSELWLSPDTDPSKKVRIATVGYFTGVREWDKYPAQKSVAIALQAGKSYYIEALHKEGLYSDNLAVGWQLPDGTLERPIAGNRLSPFVSSTGRIGDSLEETQSTSIELLAYPVPASEEISFEFSFPEEQQVTMQLYDMRGNLVATLFNEKVGAEDKYRLVYQVGSLTNGVYLIRLAGKNSVKHQKIIIDKH